MFVLTFIINKHREGEQIGTDIHCPVFVLTFLLFLTMFGVLDCSKSYWTKSESDETCW